MNPQESTLVKASGLFRAGKRDEAVSLLRRVLAKDPSELAACRSLCEMLILMGAQEQARFAAQRTTQARPNDPKAVLHEASVLARSGQAEAAVKLADRARELAGGDVQTQREVCGAYNLAGRQDLALGHARGLWAAHPGNRTALAALIEALLEHGLLDEVYGIVRGVVDAEGLDTDLARWQCMHVNYVQSESAESVLAVHQRAGRMMTEETGATPVRWALNREPERKLRVAYVSQDFRNRSAAHFIEPIVRAHDRERFEVYLYHAQGESDEMTERLKGMAAGFLRVSRLTDADLAARLRSDRADIAVDLTGHTGGNRLGAFAHFAAPVTVTYMGYPNTTGLPRSRMGYRLVDEVTDPLGSERWATEELVRLAPCFLCYAAPAHTPDVTPGPASGGGPVTFGSFNSMAKVTPAVLDLWARVLNTAPASRLFLKNLHLGAESLRERLRAHFAGAGIEAGRLEFSGELPAKEAHLAAYSRVDVALDPFPYNGTTTTVEAMLMGVPVVTLLGDSHRARVGASLLNVVGHPELIAKDAGEYVRVAAELAADRARLVSLRSSLRGAVLNSPLCDAPAFVRKLEDAYRAMWRRWCAEAT